MAVANTTVDNTAFDDHTAVNNSIDVNILGAYFQKCLAALLPSSVEGIDDISSSIFDMDDNKVE